MTEHALNHVTIKAFIKCLKQLGFLFRTNNYTYFLISLNLKICIYFDLLLSIFFISTQTQNNIVYHLIKVCFDF